MSANGKDDLDNNVEKQPLHENQELNKSNCDQNQVIVSLLENHEEHQYDDHSPKIPSYCIEPAYQNTLQNPYRETTITVPHLIRKVPEEDLTPRPFKSFNQILIFTYISVIFCMCIGAYANKNAWKAKIHLGKGLYGLAQKRATRAVYCSYVSFVAGVLIFIIIILAVTL
jgi:hypothetical protein